MRPKKSKVAAAALCIWLLSFGTVGTAFAETGTGYDLSDNIIEFNEVGALVENYSVLGKIETSMLENTGAAMDNARNETANARKELQQSLSDSIDDLKENLNNTKEPELRKALQTQINQLRRLRNSSHVYLPKSDPLYLVNKGLSEYRDGEKSLKDNKQLAENGIKKNFYNSKKLMTNGMQALFFSYKQMELNERLISKQVEMYQLSYDKAVKQQSLGSATSMDVTAAEIQLLGAKNSLEQIRNGVDSMKRALGLSLGWSTGSYQNIQLGALPEYDLNYMDGRVFEVDVKSAKQQNADWGQVLRMNDKDITGWNEKDILLQSTDQQIQISMTALRNEVLQKKEEYEAASTSAELARLKKEKADRMNAAGLLGSADYDGLQMDYINKENTAEQAKMNYNLSVFNYEEAVHKGVLTLEAN